MTEYGYTLMGEQSDPRWLVRDAVAAEAAGFPFAVMSDHYFPWLPSQGHAPNAWATLGAVAHATTTLELITYVTCPILRYHPVVVAQQAATVDVLAEGRFTLGLGAGENLNEHVVGQGWPGAPTRHEMLVEAVEIIGSLFAGDSVTFRGVHYNVDNAKLWDLREGGPRLGIAVSGPVSCELAGQHADVMISTEPDKELGEMFDRAGGAGKPRVAQLPVCYDPDRDAAIDRAYDQFRWFGGGWRVNADLPGNAGFAGASAFVRKEDVANAIPCGADVAAVVAAVQPFLDAGYTHLAFVQVGGEHQQPFIDWARRELLPALV